MVEVASGVLLYPFSLDRVIQAVEDVRQRLLKAASALEGARVPFAVAGGHAVASWVTRVDKAAVRATQDVDILVRRDDFPAVRRALDAAGFYYQEVMNVPMFLDDENASPRDAVHILFAGEKVQSNYALPAPDIDESEPAEHFRIVTLEALLRMKLTSYRRKDQVHIQDLIQVGLVDSSWTELFSEPLRGRLQALLDDPNG